MRTINIPNDENITITLDVMDYSDDHSISIDGHIYACICIPNGLNKVNLTAIGEWVTETYYNQDYLCDQYIPCRISLSEFLI